MKKILFFIPTLSAGGAEKVLVNLVNSLDKKKYCITVKTLFDVGVNKKFLSKNIKYDYFLKKRPIGIETIFKLFSPSFLFKIIVRKKYDYIISYLEGTVTRIISGCNYDCNLITWIHTEMQQNYSMAFRNKDEMVKCYENIDKIICVSDDVRKSFNQYTDLRLTDKLFVIKNVINPSIIVQNSREKLNGEFLKKDVFRIITVGRLDQNKNQIRLIPMIKKLNDLGINVELIIIGDGDEYSNINKSICDLNLTNVFMLGYLDNPYNYIASSDLYVCTSHKEGYSTTVMESLILNVPVLTTDCSGMNELLDNGKYGSIVKDDDEVLYNELLRLISKKEIIMKYKNNQKKLLSKLKISYENNIKDFENIVLGDD